MPAFDAHRPPDPSIIADCVHCGFCLPACPTYLLWGQEADSPRGRIVLMSEGLTEGSVLSADMVEHFDRCLGCMACVTACPSGVAYDRLIEATRAQVERNYPRPLADRLWRRLLITVFTTPGLLDAGAALATLARRLGLDRLAREAGLLERFPRLAALASLAPLAPAPAGQLPGAPPDGRLAAGATPAASPELLAGSRGTAGLLLGCANRVFFSAVNEATARVLAAEGFAVVAPPAAGCCGALAIHAGFEPEARRLAKATIAAFEGCDVVVVNAAGCGSAMKDYPALLAGEAEWAERAAAFSAKTRDICELLAASAPRAARHPVPVTVAYHDACHLAHAQKIRAQPRSLLRGIPELRLAEPAEAEVCCGSAGIYNLLEVEAAAALGDRKAGNLLATGAELIASGNPGCSLQIASRLPAGTACPVVHPVQILDASLHTAGGDAARRALGLAPPLPA
jgi:glycolate oxidase iron-sulfur subunit